MRRTWFALVALCAASSTFAIVPNLGADSEFGFVGRTAGGSLVAVGPNVVMTAKHITLSSTITFGSTGGGTTYQVDLSSQTDIGGSDIRLYRTIDTLPGWYDIDYSALPVAYNHTESGDNINFDPTGGSAIELRGVGYGISGTVNGTGTGYNLTSGTSGTRRQASFFSDSRGTLTVGGVGTFQNIISFLVNNGDGTLADQDSGGGLFRNVGGSWKLVGINSFTASDTQGRTFGSDFNGRLFTANSQLHFLSGFAELAPHEAAIRAFLVPEPATMTAFGLAALALIRRRRK